MKRKPLTHLEVVLAASLVITCTPTAEAPILLGWNLSSLFGEGVPGPDNMMYVQNVC